MSGAREPARRADRVARKAGRLGDLAERIGRKAGRVEQLAERVGRRAERVERRAERRDRVTDPPSSPRPSRRRVV